jgi:hypothetical protein
VHFGDEERWMIQHLDGVVVIELDAPTVRIVLRFTEEGCLNSTGQLVKNVTLSIPD